ncbi:MAG: RluA family pseudouridine synthase [Deltaproteobacteria bacterium]|nr:RluA family pseudouridine synthase [Deltaproteobacteria bacterium]MBT4087562.1 RluA family pseudouridine synthase [Deltaproteobacteria bacterium]MBT4268789.1 RluA family pseudouridine synthase [Deltaproteobacteria bacterium]MBT4641930.1 RluA family pseudouridine synthase [Deltaproteobacteria bacterium]MBT6503394.1 RluA family pseudouridine synthase [Deltaproteobacteria bacterium]
MLYRKQKVFRYRYDFDPKLLEEFIRERYFNNESAGKLEEILSTRVSLNGEAVDDKTVVQKGDWIEYIHLRSDEDSLNFEPEILYEDDWLIAISKPDFLPVIPNTSFYFNSLAILVKEKLGREEINPVHRLDIETSGVLLFGKNRNACSEIQRLFRIREVEKRYQAITFEKPTVNSVTGNLVPARDSKIYTKLELESSDKGSRTVIEKCESWGSYYRLWIKPVTGKTNQIRAHLAAINCPIVGDKKYYPDESVFLDWFAHRDIERVIDRLKLARQALHSESLSFIHPFTQKTLYIQDETHTWMNKIQTLIPDSLNN